MITTGRRELLCAAGGASATLAGCLRDTGGGPESGSGKSPPVVDRPLPEAYTAEELADNLLSGGPGKDGIPSVDSPSFAPADEAPEQLQPQDPVFGVSGQPINSNLVMYDRGTGSHWPQMLARGITGPHAGDYLREFQVVWTTWRRWQTAYSGTSVLTEQTGIARDYGRDPYGTYNPRDGYYADEGTLFPPLASSETFDNKTVVIGARTRNGAVAVPKARLRDETVVQRTVDGTRYATVYDHTLDTAYVYRNPRMKTISSAPGGVTVAGETFEADSLPLERQIGYDAIWMAWYGYYPSTEVHR